MPKLMRPLIERIGTRCQMGKIGGKRSAVSSQLRAGPEKDISTRACGDRSLIKAVNSENSAKELLSTAARSTLST